MNYLLKSPVFTLKISVFQRSKKGLPIYQAFTAFFTRTLCGTSEAYPSPRYRKNHYPPPKNSGICNLLLPNERYAAN
jgi:hypothetical protein